MAGIDLAISVLDKSGRGAASVIRNFGKVAAAGIAIGGVAVVAGIFKATSAASDLAEAINATEVSFGPAGASLIAFSEMANLRLGVTRQSYLESATALEALTRGIGEGVEGQAGAVDSLIERASDVGSVYNTASSEISAAFASVLAGETETGRRFGIDSSAARIEAFTGKSIMELTELEKRIARYEIILIDTDKTVGDFTNTQTGFANATRTLGAVFTDDLLLPIGMVFLPLMESVLAVTLAQTPAIRDLSQAFAGNLAPAIQTLADDLPAHVTAIGGFFMAIGSGYQEARDTIEEAQEGVTKFGMVFRDAIEMVVIPAITAFQVVLAGTLLGRINGLANLFERVVLPNLRKVADAFGTAFPAAVIIGQQALDDIREAWGEFIRVLNGEGGGDTVGSVVEDDVIPAWTGITEIWERNLKPTFDELGETAVVVGEALGLMAQLVGEAWSDITGVVDEHSSTIVRIIRFAFDTIGTGLQIALDVITGTIQFFLNLVQLDWAGAWEDISRTDDRYHRVHPRLVGRDSHRDRQPQPAVLPPFG